jgi:hypothetical protein
VLTSRWVSGYLVRVLILVWGHLGLGPGGRTGPGFRFCVPGRGECLGGGGGAATNCGCWGGWAWVTRNTAVPPAVLRWHPPPGRAAGQFAAEYPAPHHGSAMAHGPLSRRHRPSPQYNAVLVRPPPPPIQKIHHADGLSSPALARLPVPLHGMGRAVASSNGLATWGRVVSQQGATCYCCCYYVLRAAAGCCWLLLVTGS